jgi:hypothetical protein
MTLCHEEWRLSGRAGRPGRCALNSPARALARPGLTAVVRERAV